MAHNVDWASAHTAYKIHDFTLDSSPTSLLTKNVEWRKLQESMPHGHLLEHNSFFDSHKDGKIYMVHGTSNLKDILSSGSLRASAGCLVGSIYGSQVFPEGDRFRMHNLGDYILHEEVPSILAAHDTSDRTTALLLFEITLPKHTNPLRAGIDYLRMGGVHYDLYKSLRYLLTREERQTIESEITSMIQNSFGFLAYSNHLFLTNSKFSITVAKDYLQKLNVANDELPMLAYLYFEAISEYLMLNSTDEKTNDLAKKGEFNNWLYKELMYGIYANLKGDFSIHCFNPTVEDLGRYVTQKESEGSLKIDLDNMLTYVAERVVYWINTRFLSKPGSSVNWLDSALNFDSLSEVVAPLIGHSIHRQLRAQDRYKDFYFYFDHTKALQIWNYWNKANIAIPFNGVFPKGEIGINPAYTNMKYRVYLAEAAGDKSYIHPIEELQLEITPRLVDLNKSFMRAGGHYSLRKQKSKNQKEYVRN